MFFPTWLTAGSLVRAAAVATVAGRRTYYRTYTILTRLASGGAVATVYSGEDFVYRAHASNEIEALLRAQQWIDEQEAYATETDLHAGQQAAA